MWLRSPAIAVRARASRDCFGQPATQRAGPSRRTRPWLPAPIKHRQSEAAGAFPAASRSGDSGALLAVPSPDVVLVADQTAVQADASKEVRGAAAPGENPGHDTAL